MAWGYWSAHALPPSSRVERSSSPVPILRSRSRDQSLERDRREREQSAFTTPARSAICSSTASVSTAHQHRIGTSSPDTDLDYRTRSERGTLPRGKSIDDVNWVPERNTLPRGKSDCDSSWTDRGLVRGKSDNDWGERLSRNAKSGSEGEWCPACSSGSRVSFQSVKGSGEGSSGAEGGGKASSNILSSSLPTPPPPPFQASYSQPSLNSDTRVIIASSQHHKERRHSGDRSGGQAGSSSTGSAGVLVNHKDVRRLSVDRNLVAERRNSTAAHIHQQRVSIEKIAETSVIKVDNFSLRRDKDRDRDKDDRKKPRETRDSYSSHDSHKSSLSQRSSEEENNDTTVHRHPPNGRREHKAKSQSSYTRTPSSERQFESYSEACSKEGSSDGYVCRYSGCMVSSGRDTDSRLTFHSSSIRSKTTRGSRESHVSEDSRSLRHSSTGSVEEEKRPPPPPCRSSTTSGKNSVFSDDAESPKEWKTFRDSKDSSSKPLRNVETMHSNGAHVYRLGKGRTMSSRDTAASLPRRTLRSLTPDNESISFHDSIGREVTKRRRARRRSASVSSRCEDTECERGGGGNGREREFSKRLDFAQSNQSIHATSSRNSSSKSEKSSSRSSRSPSVELVRKESSDDPMGEKSGHRKVPSAAPFGTGRKEGAIH